VFCVQPPAWRLAARDLWRRGLCGMQHACIKAQAWVLRGATQKPGWHQSR
jgi:hypothetical protein